MTKRKLRRESRIKALADHLQKLANEASTRYTLLRTKAMIAKTIYDNGASVESVADKLGWHDDKLYNFLQTETDIDLRSLSDIFTAMGKQLESRAEQP